MKSRTFLILFLIFICTSPVPAGADSVVLKDGKTIRADSVWEEDNLVKCEINGSVVIYSKDDVAEIYSTIGRTEDAQNNVEDRIRQLKEKYTTHNAVLISTDGVRIRTLETWVENDGRVACKTSSGVSYIAPEKISGFADETTSDSIPPESSENLTDPERLPPTENEETEETVYPVDEARAGMEAGSKSKDDAPDADNPFLKAGGKYWEAYYKALIAAEKQDEKAYADQMAAMEKNK